MASTLKLGNIQLTGFEIPERLEGLGGTQTLSVFNYVGPRKGVQALGPKPHDINWTGSFVYEGAIQRVKTFDLYRQSGEVVRLSWAEFAYNVIVKHFKANARNEYEFDYEIHLEVVDDLSNGPRLPKAATPDSTVTGAFALTDVTIDNLDSNANFVPVPLASGLSLPEDPTTTLAYLTDDVVIL